MGDKPSLRLAVTRGGLGLELDGPMHLGPLTLSELAVALVGLAFPVDLSGGVPRFRHRRGLLERLVVEGKSERLATQLAPRLRGILGPASPSVTLMAIPGGLMVGMQEGESALAFDALWAPRDGEARWVIASARGWGLGRPALSVALAAVDAMIARFGERRGAIVTVEAAAAPLLRALLPELGARLPDFHGARWGGFFADASGFRVECDSKLGPPELLPLVIRELELASLSVEADDALAGFDYERARALYLAQLERAPRHPSLARRIAEIDRFAFERSEAALSTLTEAMPLGETGALGGELLSALGEVEDAREAYRQAADDETYPPLAALLLLAASRLADEAEARLGELDAAIARAPTLAATRWARFREKVEGGDFRGAMADLEHLEAAARGAWSRHEVFRRAGEMLLEGGYDAQAASIFERALRYAPKSPQAVAGLAKSLLATGRGSRALELFARAIELAEEGGKEPWEIVLSLAEALANEASELSAAIARVRAIPQALPESLPARGLEARWRARLGDRAGASLAFARMRELIESGGDLDPKAAAHWLVEAAAFERRENSNEAAADLHLELARKLAPYDPIVVRAEIGDLSEPSEPPAELLTEEHDAALDEAEEIPLDSAALLALPLPSSLPTFALPVDLDLDAGGDDLPSLEDEQRAEELSDRLRADPTNHEVAVELADLLARMRRDLDLFALLSARLEDAVGEEREELIPRQRATLERLIVSAREEGRDDEASLYVFALERLDELSSRSSAAEG